MLVFIFYLYSIILLDHDLFNDLSFISLGGYYILLEILFYFVELKQSTSIYLLVNFISIFKIHFLHVIFCCMSALQSPMRVHGDNIYVRHSNLMLEVGTGVVWWLKIRTTCFCVLLTPSELQLPLYSTVQDCCPLALSGSVCMPACVYVCGSSYIKSPLNSTYFLFFSFSNFSMIEKVLVLNSFSANRPNSQSSHFLNTRKLDWEQCCKLYIKQMSLKAALTNIVISTVNQMWNGKKVACSDELTAHSQAVCLQWLLCELGRRCVNVTFMHALCMLTAVCFAILLYFQSLIDPRVWFLPGRRV